MHTAADFELDERHVIKDEKVALDRLRVRQNVFLGIKMLELAKQEMWLWLTHRAQRHIVIPVEYAHVQKHNVCYVILPNVLTQNTTV